MVNRFRLSKQAFRKMQLIQKRHGDALTKRTNVVGTAIGEKITGGQRTGKAALIVFVERKVPFAGLRADEQVPTIIDGMEVDVVEIGHPELLANTQRLRPARGGISIGHINITAGTFGCLVRSEAGGDFILSNNHVLAVSNAGAFGDAVIQPGRADGGNDPVDRVGVLYRFRRVSNSSDNLADCALARPTTGVDSEILDAWTRVYSIPGWFGAQDQGAGIAIWDINGNGRPDIVAFHIDNPGGENHGYYRIGWNLNNQGAVTGGWTNPIAVPGWFGAEDQGAGVAIADINGNGRPDIVVFHLDNPGGENHGYYRIGWNINNQGVVTGGWTNVMTIPGWFGAQDQGADMAIGDLNGDGKLSMVVFHIDNPSGENRGYYRIGWNLDEQGHVTGGWTNPIRVPGWFGSEDQGAGVAIGDFTGSGRPELVIMHVDNPGGENICYYRIGRDLQTNGQASIWSEVRQVSGWFGAENQGAGLDMADLNGDGRRDLVCLHLDNPSGENHGYYRTTAALERRGDFIAPLNGTSRAEVGTRVWKSGRTTELTNGSVTYVNSTVNIIGFGRFVDQLTIMPPISAPGDSGSALVDAQNRVVGLIFAGSTNTSTGQRIASFANRIENVLEALRWSDIRPVPGWFGAQDQGAGIALANIGAGVGPDMVVFHIDNPGGENHGYYRIGWNLDGNGDVTGGWSQIWQIPGWFGAEDQGGDIALADLNGSGRPDLVVFHIDNPAGENHGYYRIGWDLNNQGQVTRWSNPIAVPGWFGAEDQGAGIALSDINGNGRQDLVVFHLDNPGGENHGYYRIGWNLDNQGRVQNWSSIMPVPGWFGAENQGAAITVLDTNGNGKQDIVVFHIDNPSGENRGYYRIGRDLDNQGHVTGGWTGPQAIPGWWGSENQGGGIASWDLNGSGRVDLLFFQVDNPGGENHGYYRWGYDIMNHGQPARFSIR